MAVADGIVWMAHTRDRPAAGPDDREDERPLEGGREVVTSDLEAIALEGDLILRLWHGLQQRDRFGGLG